MVTTSDMIISSCEKHWDEHKNNCSRFVKAVAQDFNIILTGQANEIADQIQKKTWRVLNDGKEADTEARAGKFVVGRMKANGNGHVVIVIPGALAHGKYPAAYWGSMAGLGRKNSTINYSWNVSNRDKVIYASRQI